MGLKCNRATVSAKFPTGVGADDAEEVEQAFPDEAAMWQKDPYTFAPLGGESGLSVTARALPVLMDIVREHPTSNVLVVSHKATIRLLLSSLLGFDPRRYRDNLDQSPAALNIVDFKNAVSSRLTLFNDTSHYAAAGLAIPGCSDISFVEGLGFGEVLMGDWLMADG